MALSANVFTYETTVKKQHTQEKSGSCDGDDGENPRKNSANVNCRWLTASTHCHRHPLVWHMLRDKSPEDVTRLRSLPGDTWPPRLSH